MTVDALRLYFRNLSEILQSGKGSKEILDDLAAIDRGLTPFATLPLKSFADFLEKAQNYDPNAVIGKKPPRVSTPRVPKVTVDIEGIAATVKHLFDEAARPDTTIESIDEGLKVLDTLKKAQLIVVAKAIKAEKGLSSKKEPDVREIIKNAVRGMWGSARRVKQ